MGDDKGKGRATNIQDESNRDNQGSAETPPETTAFSRVIASATGLASSAFSAPSSKEINDGRAALLGDSKPVQTRTNGSSSSAWAESAGPSGQVSSRPNDSQAGGFRSKHEEEHVRQMESEFSSFLDGIEQFTPDVNVLPGEDHVNTLDSLQLEAEASQSDGLRDVTRTQMNLNHVYEPRNTDLTIAEQEIIDGQDVVGILSQPSTMDESIDELENLDLQLTPEQIYHISSITNNLFLPPAPHSAPPVDHPLNLQPNLDVSSSLASREAYSNDYGSEQARHEFITQWDDILTSYTDEVWGNLLPLVKEARQEVETIKNQDDPPEIPKALRRLGQIFNHLRK